MLDEANGTEKTDKSEKKDKDETDSEKKPTPPKPVLNKRQSTRSMLSKKSSTLKPAYKLQKFCVYTLCEHDEVRSPVTTI